MYWFSRNWTGGQLGICPRPRGNDWLEDELKHFQQSGVDILVSALESSESLELELQQEAQLCAQAGMDFLSFPIVDRNVPDSMKSFTGFTRRLSQELTSGKTIMIHCRQGIGRSSLLAAGVMVHLTQQTAQECFVHIAKARGRDVPDTMEQIKWLETWIASNESTLF